MPKAEESVIKRQGLGVGWGKNFPGSPVVGIHPFTAKGMGLISGGESKIPQVIWYGQPKNKIYVTTLEKGKGRRKCTDSTVAVYPCMHTQSGPTLCDPVPCSLPGSPGLLWWLRSKEFAWQCQCLPLRWEWKQSSQERVKHLYSLLKSWDITLLTSDMLLSRVQLFATPWAVACQSPRSMEFSRQKYCV